VINSAEGYGWYMKIIVDAFGGDNAPLEILKGSAQAVAEYGVNIILVGNKEIIEKISSENSILLYHIDIADTKDVITMQDEPSEIMKSKSNSSMAKGLRLLAENQGDAFISAGNSGALVMGSTFIVKRVRGIKRCAIAPIMPRKDGFFMLVDGGANVECRPEMLFQFAMMGSMYMTLQMWGEACGMFMRCISLKENRLHGATSFFPYHNLGVISELLGEKEIAKNFYRMAGDYKRSADRLKELEEEQV